MECKVCEFHLANGYIHMTNGYPLDMKESDDLSGADPGFDQGGPRS